MRKYWFLGIVVLLLIVVSACVAGSNPTVNIPVEGGRVAGFWTGFWHGFILFWSFLMSLFWDNVNIYEVRNNGVWYNFGFMLGIGSIFGGLKISFSLK